MATINITVQSLLNAGLYDPYTVSDGITVAALKTTISGATGVDVSWFVLVFNDAVLVDGDTLLSSGIVDGSVLRSGNVIDSLPTLQDRQVAKLDLATLDRTASSNPYNVYDINLLPSKYIGNVSTPNVHPNGLIQGRPWIVPTPLAYLDAGNVDSYSGVGSTWYDLSATGGNATLFNSPLYSQIPGTFTFDDTSGQWAEVPNLGDLNTWSVEVWFKVNTSLAGHCTAVVCNEYDLGSKLNFSIGTNVFPTNSNICVGFFDGTWRTTSGFSPVLDTWYNVIGTYDGTTISQYVNGVLGTTLAYSGTPQSGGAVRIASRWDVQVPPNDFFPGDVAMVRIYDTALTADQVLSNYNEYAPRFS